MVSRMFSEHKVPEHFIMDYLYKIYLGTLKAMADNDEEFLREYLEKNFSDKLVARLKEMRGKGYSFKVVEEIVGNAGQPVPNKIDVVDSVFIRGLFMDRSKNGTEEDYHIYNDIDGMVSWSITLGADDLYSFESY